MLKEKKIDIDYCMLIMLIIKTMLIYSRIITLPSKVELVIECVVYFCWFYSLLKFKLEKRKFLLLILVGMFCIYTGYLSNSFIIFSSYMIFCLSIFKRKEDTIKVMYITIYIVVVLHIIFYILQFFYGRVDLIRDSTGRIRYSLGFTNPNIVGYYVLWAFLGCIYCNIKNEKRIVFAFGFTMLVYFFTKCNTLIIMSLIAIIGLKFIKMNKMKILLTKISRSIVVILTLFIIISTQLYGTNNVIGKKINKLFNQRIYYSYEAIKEYGFTILGQKYDADINLKREESYMSTSLILDVMYTNFLCRWGIIYLLILILLSNYISKKSTDIEKFLVILWAIFALSETVSVNFSICFPMLFAADYFKLKEKENDKRNS